MSNVLDFIKAHTFALACAVVAVIGLLAFFVYPIPGMFASLRGEVDGRQAVYSSIDGQLKASRTLPVVSIDSTEPPKLDPFPTNAIIKQGKEMLVHLSDESKRVLEAANQQNRREPLTPDALPNGLPIARNQFLNDYKRATAQSGPDADKGILRTILHGALPPSPEELLQIGNQRAADIARKMSTFGPNNQLMNGPAVEAEIAKMKANLQTQIRTQRAFASTIFVSPDAVETHPALKGNDKPDLVTMFNAQFSLWLQSMVFESLNAANTGAKNVYEAPVKHLIKLDVPMNFAGSGGGLAGMSVDTGVAPTDPTAAAAAAAPVELKPDSAAAITPAYLMNPLGYTSNAMYDPIRVRITLRVDATKLPQVLASMQTAKFLKIKNVNMRTVDKGLAMSQGYVYDRDGTTPLVEVILDADVLVLRQWLVAYMPDPVKRFFASLSTATPGATPAG